MAVRELTEAERAEIGERALKRFHEQMNAAASILKDKREEMSKVRVEVERFTDEQGAPKIKFHKLK